MTLEVTAQVRVSGEFELQVAFAVPPGITVLQGPSGAGKTTVLKVVAGLLRGNGQVRLANATWEGAGVFVPAEARRVGFVFQSLALFPHLTALDNVRFGGVDEAAAMRWLARLRVEALAQRKPSSFSGGEAQRVALARALARTPQVLLLDEPFTSLDPALRAELQHEVQRVVTELNIPALLVTHDLAEAASLASQTLHLVSGRLVAG